MKTEAELSLVEQFSLWCAWDNLRLKHFGERKGPTHVVPVDGIESVMIAAIGILLHGGWIYYAIVQKGVFDLNELCGRYAIPMTILLAVTMFIFVGVRESRRDLRRDYHEATRMEAYNRDLAKLSERFGVDLSSGYYREFCGVSLSVPNVVLAPENIMTPKRMRGIIEAMVFRAEIPTPNPHIVTLDMIRDNTRDIAMAPYKRKELDGHSPS